MTSHIIDQVKGKETSPRWRPADDGTFCAFCRIIYEGARAHKVYEDDHVIGILDILPLRRGHVLLIPKGHHPRVSELPPEVASAVGQAVSKVANALTKALNNTALNIVCNQEYAQAVPHAHYHIIPAPRALDEKPVAAPLAPLSQREMHRLEFHARQELDDDEAEDLCLLIRSKL